MTSEHQKTLEELFLEKRRWVLHCSPEPDPDGQYRAEIVVEDYPFRVAIGEVTNLTDVQPPLLLGSDRAEAEAKVIRWNLEHRGVDHLESLRIVASSMGAQSRMRGVYIKRDPSTSEAVLFTGFGDELITLEEEDAKQLYVQLGEAYGWQHDEFCPQCGCTLEYGYCPECRQTPEEGDE